MQINGKIKDRFFVPTDISKEKLEAEALKLETVRSSLEGKTPKKVIVVPGRLVNILV